jgi:hypothetical protein
MTEREELAVAWAAVERHRAGEAEAWTEWHRAVVGKHRALRSREYYRDRCSKLRREMRQMRFDLARLALTVEALEEQRDAAVEMWGETKELLGGEG